MKTIEHRRHTMRVQPGQHLSQAGVTLARGLGQTLGPFAHVTTSPVIRAYETAIAMGFAVHDLRDELKMMPEKVEEIVPHPSPFAVWADAMRTHAVVQTYGNTLSDFMRETLDELDDGDSALLISHGGIVEASAIACHPDYDWASAGPELSYCEGVRMVFEGVRCIAVSLLRCPSVFQLKK